jgi:pSer/pThr/pTyr-binding forkhead associated (FHA) protein
MPCLFVVSGPDEGLIYTLDASAPVTIGRGDDAIMQLVDERASRVHCGLTPAQESAGDFGIPVTQWVLTDAGSSNGTRIGNETIDGEVKLCDGDVIGLGRSGIAFLQDDYADADDARARCSELSVHLTESDAGWPMDNPATKGTLTDE